MAALNVFKTVTYDITDTVDTIYTAPTGYTGIVLMAQITNVTSSSGSVTLSTFNGVSQTELIKDYLIPGNDAVSAITGKLVLEVSSSIRVQASENSKFKITLSVLESSNE
jgi:hypothetical protein